MGPACNCPTLRLLSVVGATAVAVACCTHPSMPPSPDQGVAIDAAADVQGADSGPDVSFVTAAHAPYPQVPNNGGPTMSHPQVVLITFSDDPSRAVLEDATRWLVGSSWVATVGAEYGIASASAIMNELGTTAPTTVLSDGDVAAMIAQGIQDQTIFSPTGGDYSNEVYMVAFPANSAEAGSRCTNANGWHNDALLSVALPDAGPVRSVMSFAVVLDCAVSAGGRYTDVEYEEMAISHEFIETATDPQPNALAGANARPGYVIEIPPVGAVSAWAFGWRRESPTCAHSSREDSSRTASWRRGFGRTRPRWRTRVQTRACRAFRARSITTPWSHRPTRKRSTPTRPPAMLAAPQVVAFDLVGFSSAPIGVWERARSHSDRSRSIQPPVTAISPASLGNGGAGQLRVTVPAGTYSPGEYGVVLLVSDQTATDDHVWIGAVYAE